MSFIHGDVSTRRGDNGQWEALTLNTPIMPGDRIATAHDSKAEVQLDYASVLRMANDATATLKNLDRSNIQVQVGQGLVTYSVLRAGGANTEIDTPNAGVHPLGVGEYRILVNSDAETQVIVRTGSADVSTPQGSTHVEQGQMITIAGTDNPQYKTDPAPGRDDWDTWSNDRNHVITSADSWRHTDQYYVGSQDLDSNGTWSEIPDYGQVWTPRADAGWAPYREGRWVYEPYYGWTWVSYEPWGWAPYHYGRWMVYGGNWCWWPGPVGIYPGYYPIWAPAYVSFFGFGGGGFGFGVGFGFGRVGWLPIGPGDWFHPWYGRWGGRYGTVGIGNFNGIHEGFGPLGRGRAAFSNINEGFRNDRIRGGISSMGSSEFGRGAVSARQEGISAASFRQASAMSGRMPISPSRESFSATNRAASAATIRNGSSSSQRFFSSSRAGSASFANGGARGSSSIAGRSEGSFGNAGRASSAQGVESNGRGAENTARGSSSTQGGWQHFTPSSSASRGGTYGGSSAARPTLNMRQNIVTPRSGGSSGSSAYGRSTYGGPTYSSPSARGSSSEPRSYNVPRNESAPRSYSAPGGGSSAPRGNYNAPRGESGGGSSRGGGSSSRGGGGGGSHGGSHSSGHR